MSGPTIQFVIADINKAFKWTVHKQFVMEVVNYHWGPPGTGTSRLVKPLLMSELVDYIKARDMYTRRYYAASSH